ncbi:MAG: hypothetical protein WC802_04650 [Patescibacteria group bacterium]|jgi:hypothetical protein
MTKGVSISKIAIKKAVAQSSKMEGQSVARARNNASIIKVLKRYGRAFSL